MHVYFETYHITNHNIIKYIIELIIKHDKYLVIFICLTYSFHTLSGCIGKMVAFHDEGCRVQAPAEACTNLYCARGAQEVLP